MKVIVLEIKLLSSVHYESLIITLKGSSLETLKQMVSIDEGITLVSKIACTKAENVKYIDIDNRDFYREIDLVMRKSSIYEDLFAKIAKIIANNY